MDFNFNIEKTLGGVSRQGVAFISGEDEHKYSNEDLKNINILLDKIGQLSANVRIKIKLINLKYLGPRITNCYNFRL